LQRNKKSYVNINTGMTASKFNTQPFLGKAAGFADKIYEKMG